MAKKNHRESGAKSCTCDKCGTEAHAIPGTNHRRCPEGWNKPLLPKGVWSGSPGTWG